MDLTITSAGVPGADWLDVGQITIPAGEVTSLRSAGTIVRLNLPLPDTYTACARALRA